MTADMKTLIIVAAMLISAFALADVPFTYNNYLTSQTAQQVQLVQTNSVPKQVVHRKTLWTSGMMTYEVIDGHHYIVTSIRNSGYGSFGITSVVHAESCPCKKKAEKN